MVVSSLSIVVEWSLRLFVFKQRTAYEMRISDWSSDVCSSDLGHRCRERRSGAHDGAAMSAVEGPGWSVGPAPAKLNLFLRILGRRADDYHVLQTVFQLIDWLDEVHLRARNDGQIVRVAGPDGVPAAEIGRAHV